jgi:hypothetical protein
MKTVAWRMTALWMTLLVSSLTAHPQEILNISRIQAEFNFDGVVDDACWQNITPFQMVMHTPVFENQPTERSEVMVCYDNTYIYVGARLFDSDVSDMLVTSRKRDESSAGNESFTILFDSFNDNENGLVFSTTPSGLRSDYTVFSDAITSSPRNLPVNFSWNTFWDVKTTLTDQGWFLEMRIPLSSLRFKVTDGQVIMGLSCSRRIAHKNETDVYPAIPPEWGTYSNVRPSLAQKVAFTGIESRKPFYIAPYAIAGFQQDNSLNETNTGYTQNEKPKFNAGLDAKYGLTNNLTLDVTLNTDFAQVEADDEQINLTRFSLFFPEKRTFFQERSSIFNFDFEGRSNLFYSRQIGLYKGEQVPILGGTRITGMAGKWDLGFLDMQTAYYDPTKESLADLPSENFGVLRLRRQIINPSTYVGGIFTSRLGMDGTYNVSYGLDGIFRFLKNDYLNFKVAQAMATNNQNQAFSADPTRLFLNWKRYSDKGLGYSFTYTRSGKDFNPGIGFQQRRDYSYYAGSLQYGWIPASGSFLMNHKIDVNAEVYTLNGTGALESSATAFEYKFYMKRGLNGMIGLVNNFEDVTEDFSLSENAVIPAEKYRFTQFVARLHSADSKVLKVNLDATIGGFYDGKLMSIVVEPLWSIGSVLNMSLSYEFNKAQFNGREQSFSSNIARLKALLMITNKLSVSSFLQYNDVDHALITNVRIRYNPGEGNDFFIVFNEGRNTLRDMQEPRLPAYNNRSVLLKYTYTFTL